MEGFLSRLVGLVLYLIFVGVSYWFVVRYFVKHKDDIAFPLSLWGSSIPLFIVLCVASWVFNLFPLFVLINDLELPVNNVVFLILLMICLTIIPGLIILRRDARQGKYVLFPLLLGGIACYAPFLGDVENPTEVFIHAKRANMIDGSFYREGRFVRKNLDKADEVDREILERWLPDAEAGDTHGMYIVGRQYRLLKDQRCIVWLEKAAAGGNKDALNELSEIRDGKNDPWW